MRQAQQPHRVAQRAELLEVPVEQPVMRLAVLSPRPFVRSSLIHVVSGPVVSGLAVSGPMHRPVQVSYSKPSRETKSDFGSTNFNSFLFLCSQRILRIRIFHTFQA